MAEREGFEPSEELPLRFLSKEVLSTTQPSLRNRVVLKMKVEVHSVQK